MALELALIQMVSSPSVADNLRQARALLARQVEAMRALPAALRPVLRDASTLTSEALLATNLIDGVVGPDA